MFSSKTGVAHGQLRRRQRSRGVEKVFEHISKDNIITISILSVSTLRHKRAEDLCHAKLKDEEH